MHVDYPCGMVSISSLGFFSVGSSSKPYHPSINISLSIYLSMSTTYSTVFQEEEWKEAKIYQST